MNEDINFINLKNSNVMKRNWQVSGSTSLRMRIYGLMVKGSLDKMVTRMNEWAGVFKNAVGVPNRG